MIYGCESACLDREHRSYELVNNDTHVDPMIIHSRYRCLDAYHTLNHECPLKLSATRIRIRNLVNRIDSQPLAPGSQFPYHDGLQTFFSAIIEFRDNSKFHPVILGAIVTVLTNPTAIRPPQQWLSPCQLS